MSTPTHWRLISVPLLACFLVSQTVELSGQEAAQSLRQAEKLHNNKKYEESQAVILSSLQKWPHSYLKPEFLVLLSATYLNDNDPEQSLVILNHLFKQNPRYKEDATARLIQANILQKKGRIDEAQTVLLDLKSEEGLYQSGLLMEQSGQSFAAVARFNQLISDYPEGALVVPAQLALAFSYFTLGDYQSVVDQLEPLNLSSNSEDLEIRNYLMGSAFLNIGDSQKGYAALNQVALSEKSSLSPYAKTFMGLYALDEQDFSRAEEILKNNLSTRNRTCLVQSATALVEIYLRKQEPQKAIKVSQQALTKVKKKELKARLLMLRGVSFQQAGQIQLALTDFEDVLALNQPKWSPRALTLMAHTLWFDAQYARLVTDFRKTFSDSLNQFQEQRKHKFNPASSDEIHLAQLLMAEANFGLKQYGEAEVIYKEILSGTPSPKRTAQAISGLISSLVYQKKFDQSEKHLDELMVRFGEDRDVLRFGLLTQAHFLWNRKNYKKAQQKYQRYAEMFPGDSKAAYARYQEGRTLHRIGEHEKALMAWEDLRENYSNSPYVFQSLLMSARAANKLGEASRAQKFYQQVASQGSGEQIENALFELGLSQYQSHRYSSAIQTFDQLLNQFPRSKLGPKVQKKLKLSYQQLARTDFPELQKITRKFSDASHAGEGRFQIGLNFYETKQFQKAIREFEIALRDHPYTPSAADAFFYKGESEFRLGYFEKSLGTFRNFTQNYPKHHLFYLAELLRARSLQGAGYLDEAILVYQRVTQGVPNSTLASSAFLDWGNALGQKNNVEKQMLVYEVFLTEFPGHSASNRIYLKLGHLARRKGDFQVALVYYRKVRPVDGLVSVQELKEAITSLEEVQ